MAMARDNRDQLLSDFAEARKKKKKRQGSPKTPYGSPPHPPPPPPPPAGPSGTSRASGASGLSQSPPPPPPPSNTQGGHSTGTDAPSSSKTAASAEYTAWTMTDTRIKSSISPIPEELHMGDDTTVDEQAYSSSGEDVRRDHIPTASALKSTYTPTPTRELTLAQIGICNINGLVSDNDRRLPPAGRSYRRIKPYQISKGCKALEYKHDFTVIDSPRAVTFRDKYGVQMIMRFNEIHKFSDGTLQQIDEALDYRVKEFRVNRMNPGLDIRFWMKKDVDRSKEFMFAI
ncbi:hypothetical protein Tco_1137493 [Tanacetum coccineum]